MRLLYTALAFHLYTHDDVCDKHARKHTQREYAIPWKITTRQPDYNAMSCHAGFHILNKHHDSQSILNLHTADPIDRMFKTFALNSMRGEGINIRRNRKWFEKTPSQQKKRRKKEKEGHSERIHNTKTKSVCDFLFNLSSEVCYDDELSCTNSLQKGKIEGVFGVFRGPQFSIRMKMKTFAHILMLLSNE